VSPAGRAFDPPPGRCWVYTRDRYQELLEDGRIWFGRDGTSGPSVKRFLDEVSSGVVPGTWWAFEDVGHNQEAKQALVAMFPGQTPFDTPKPERLLQRIVHIASNPGDIVLDAFAGSGTTAAVAHKMRRGWVAVEREESTVEAFTRPRLAKVVDGEDRGGITEAVGWIGGGGVRELRGAPPPYPGVETAGVRAPDDGAPSIGTGGAAGWASQPFAGRKGRARLAVVAGVADESLVDGLLAGLDEGETLTLATTMAAPGTAQALRARSRGSRLLLVPHDLFRSRGAVS